MSVPVSKPVQHGVNLFAKLVAQHSDFSSGVIMAEETPQQAALISSDLKERLRQRQATMARGGPSSMLPTAPQETKEAKGKPVQPSAASSDDERFQGRSSAAKRREAPARRASSTSSSGSDSSSDSVSSAADTSSSAHSSGYSSSASSSTSTGSDSNSDDGLYEDVVGMQEDFYSFSSPTTTLDGSFKAPASSGFGTHALGPTVSMTWNGSVAATVNLRLQSVIDYPFPSGNAPLVIPLWAVQRFHKTGALYCNTNAAIALHQEICDFVDWMRPNEAEVVMRRLVEIQLSEIATELWPSCEPCAYGSIATQLLLPTSDVDMTVLSVPEATEDALLKLCRAIVQHNLGVSAFPQMILKTKVPLLKFATRLGGVEVDVSVNASDGKSSSETVNGMLRRFPEARSLIVVVKHFLASREMNEPFKGTLGSFATTCLVISFLQQHPIYTTHIHLRPAYGLGKLLVDFFRYYAVGFNYVRVGLSLVRGGSCFPRPAGAASDGPRGPAQVIIEDPSNSANNVASSLRFFQNIRSAFEGAYNCLTSPPGATQLDRPLDTGLVNATAPVIAFRPTLLSRILHTTDDISKRRERAAAGLKELEDNFPADFVAKVKAFKREQDAPMMQPIPTAPMTDPLALIDAARALRPSRLETIFNSPSAAKVAEHHHHHQHQQNQRQGQHHQPLGGQRVGGQRRDADFESRSSQPARYQPPAEPRRGAYEPPQGGQHNYRNNNDANLRVPPPPPLPRHQSHHRDLPPPPVLPPPPPIRGGQQHGQQRPRHQPRGGKHQRYEEDSSSSDDGGAPSWQQSFNSRGGGGRGGGYRNF